MLSSFLRLCLLLIALLTSCQKNMIDRDLDSLNLLVTKLENKSKKEVLKFDDYIQLQQEILQSQSETNILIDKAKLNSSQKKRAEEITNRLGKLILKNKNIQY